MKRMILSSIAAASLACTAAPVTAQDEPEEARTTCTVEFLRFAPNKAETWTEMREKSGSLRPKRQAYLYLQFIG